MQTSRILSAVVMLAALNACGPTVTLTPPPTIHLYSPAPPTPPAPLPTATLTCTVADPAGLPVSPVCSLANSNAAAGTVPATIAMAPGTASGTATFTAAPVTIDETTTVTATFLSATPATTTITVHPHGDTKVRGGTIIQVDPSVTRVAGGLLRYTYFISVSTIGPPLALTDDLLKVGAVFTVPVTPVSQSCVNAAGGGGGPGSTTTAPAFAPAVIYIVDCNVISATMTITFDVEALSGGTAILEIFLRSTATTGSTRLIPTGPR